MDHSDHHFAGAGKPIPGGNGEIILYSADDGSPSIQLRAEGLSTAAKGKGPLCNCCCYDAKSDQAQLFFKKVQNKMLWAVTQQTAA